MAKRLIATDAAVQITLGGVVDGTPNWGTATVVKALARSVEFDGETVDADVTSALGDGLEISRPIRLRGTANVELLVTDSGALFKGKQGYYCKLEVKEESTLASYDTYVGYIRRQSVSIGGDGATIEKLELKIGVDGHTYSGVWS
jgi:hypothetical protein